MDSNLYLYLLFFCHYSLVHPFAAMQLFQVYEDYAEQADTWLASKEAFLANNDLGVSDNQKNNNSTLFCQNIYFVNCLFLCQNIFTSGILLFCLNCVQFIIKLQLLLHCLRIH